MRRNLTNKVRGTLMIATLTLMAATASLAQDNKGGRLVGTWDTVVRIKDCATGNVLNTFASIGSFNQGGTSIGSTSGQPQAGRTPEHGIWRHLSGNSYLFKFKSFNFNAAGQPVSYAVVQHTVDLDNSGDTYYSSGTAAFYLMNGTPVGSACSDADGTRMTF
ncbi:MAG TPA: hypothetical protein VMZ26_15355 [Pyrinomonadaceae bacterium]|nr:hypothetical protein [Pyrinomonadaceae bacterium]